MTVHIGVDQHKAFSQVAVVDEQGQVLDNRRLDHSDRDGMRRYFARWGPEAIAVLEATRNWYWLYELLEGTVGQAKLAHPAQVRLIADSKVKTDKIDGTVLAQLDRTGFLPQAYIPSQRVRDGRELHRFRITLVRLQTMLKNRVHAVLDKVGVEHAWADLFGKQGRAFLDSLELRMPYSLELSCCLRMLDALKKEIQRTERQIRKALDKDPRSKLLRSVPGVGEILSYLVLYEVGDMARFASQKKFASYCALTPGTRQSADHCWHGHTDRRGNLYLKWAMVEAAHRAVPQDPALRALCEKHQRTKGKAKAIVIVARKLAVAVCQVLSKQEPYRYNHLTRIHLGKPVQQAGRR